MPNLEKNEFKPSFDLVETRAQRYQKMKKPAEAALHRLYGDCHLKTPENQANLDLAREHLQEGSIVWFFNHPSLDDGFLATFAVLAELGDVAQDIGGPQSRKHYDFSRDQVGAFITRLVRPVLRIEYSSVVQTYDLDFYSKEERERLNLRFGRRARKLLRQAGGVIIFAPGGTRDRGKLIKAEKGVEFLKRKGDSRVRYLPMAVIPQGPIGEGINFGHPYQLKIGELFSAEQLEEKFSQLDSLKELEFRDQLMVELGSYLSPDMWGVYRVEVSQLVASRKPALF